MARDRIHTHLLGLAFPRASKAPIRKTFFICGATLTASIALWFAGWLAVGDELLPVRWGAFVAPWLGLLALLGSLLLATARSWLAAGSLALVLLIWTPVLPRFSPARWFAQQGSANLLVMTFNTSQLNGNFVAIATLIAKERPDILLLQQLRNLPSLEKAFRQDRKVSMYNTFPVDGSDTVILSRFPLSNGKAIHGRAAAVAQIGRCRLQLWNLHAPHGQVTITDQAHFFDAAAAVIDTVPGMTIVAGDLNSTEFNSDQAPLRTSLRDAYQDAGAGLGFTFPSPVRRFGLLGTLFRIDHVLYRGGLRPVSIRVLGDNAGSDHLPTLAEFNLPPGCR